MSPAECIGSEYRSIEKWALRHLGDLEHEQQVARIALNLLRVTAPRRTLDARHRRLLVLSALLHDVGRSVNDARHPEIGARMIADATSLPISKSERRALCYLTRYHRGAVPQIGKDDYLTNNDDDDQLHLTLAYLRAADALDNRTLETPRLTFDLRRDRLNIIALLRNESAKARRIYRRRRKFRLLEEYVGLVFRIEVKFRNSPQVSLVV